MYYALAYVLIGLGTALLTLWRDMTRRDHVIVFFVWLLTWPIIWLQIAAIYIRGKNEQKCAWCDQLVAPQITFRMAVYNEEDDRLRTIWRNHYLYSCDQHPLAIARRAPGDRE